MNAVVVAGADCQAVVLIDEDDAKRNLEGDDDDDVDDGVGVVMDCGHLARKGVNDSRDEAGRGGRRRRRGCQGDDSFVYRSIVV